MFKKLISKWRAAPLANGTAQVGEPETEVVNIALFRDPPFRQGLPVVGGEQLLLVEPYAGLIDNIKKFADWRVDEYEKAIKPAIVVMANYAGLLPASQSYHHNEGGGALLHALEVGYYAMRLGGEGYYSPMGMLPSYRQRVNRRYQAVLFLAGLYHDIGKLFTDFTVTTKSGVMWNPYNGSQATWAKTNNVDRIFLSWTPQRHKNHEARYKGSLNRIVPDETIAWVTDEEEVGDYGRDLWQDLEDVLDEAPANTKINGYVIAADSKSTVGWMGVNPTSRAEGLAVPVDRYLLDLMREWVGTGKWKCNVKGARLWFVKDTQTGEEKLFINWIMAVKDLTSEIELRDIPGIPKDANRLADVLVQRSFAEPFQSPDGSLRSYWPFLPERLTKAKGRKKGRPEYGLCVQNPDHFLQSMRMPSVEKAEIGQSIVLRLEREEAARKQRAAKNGYQAKAHPAKAQSADQTVAESTDPAKAQSADQTVTESSAPSKAQSADQTVTESTDPSKAQSADQTVTESTDPSKAQSAVMIAENAIEKTNAQSVAKPSSGEEQAAPKRKPSNVHKQVKTEVTSQTRTVDKKTPVKPAPRSVPVEWKQPLDWLKAVYVEEPGVVFVDGEDKCLDVEILQRELARLAKSQHEEEPQLVHIRQAFAKEKVANLGVGMLGTVWVRRVNTEGNTVRSILLQEKFFEAVMNELGFSQSDDDTGQTADIQDAEYAEEKTANNKPTSLNIEQEAELCEAALEITCGEVSAGGKIRLRIEDAKKLLQRFELTIDDLEQVEFATLQVWMSAGSLLIKRTDT